MKKKKKKSPDSNGGKRDPQGRFLPGNRGGPGNPQVRRLAAYRKALENAISPADLKAIIKKLILKARAGDFQAAREIMDRTVGKTAPVHESQGGFSLPSIAAVEDLPRASAAIMKALCVGSISPATAGTCAALVEGVRKSFETLDLAQRIEALEQERE